MGKRGIAVIIFLLVFGLAILVWLFEKGNRNIFTDPYLAIPPNASVIIETGNLTDFMNELSGGNGIFRELASIKELEPFNHKIKFLTDLFNRKEFRSFLENNKAVISFHASYGGKIVPVLTMNIPQEIRLKSLCQSIDSSDRSNLREIKIGKNRIIELILNINGSRDTVYLAQVTGLTICTSSIDLITKTIKQTGNKDDIRTAPGFKRIMGAAGKKDDKIFIVFPNLTEILAKLFSSKVPALTSKIIRIAGSAEGDIYMNDNGIILSGYTESFDSTELLYKYKNTIPGHFDTYRVLPSATALFETMMLSDSIKGLRKSAEMSDSTFSLAIKLRPFIGQEVTSAIIDIKDNSLPEKSMMVYELRNRDMAERIVDNGFKVWLSERQLKEKDFVQYFQPDDQTKIPVYSTPFKNLSSAYFPTLSLSGNDSLFAFYDNFMVCGNSYKTISRFLYDNILNKTLFNDIVYRDFESTLPSRAAYYFYCVPSAITDYLTGFLSDTIISVLRSNIMSLRKVQALGFQFAPSNGMIYNTLSIKFKDRVREESGTEWETLLDTAACIKPFFFTNHITGAREIFIQDYRNNCYLINSAGRVLWKVSLNERIFGNVFMIDYYGNNKYQILFSGKNYLHLLDRNGNYVERFPVKLRSEASAQMALFDYDNNNDYRILIPGIDRSIYAYDRSGNVVKGWKPFQTTGLVRSEVKFFRASGKDYLIASDDNTVYFLDRTGAIRLKPKEAVSRATNSEIRLTQGTDPALIFSAPDGTIQTVSFDGNVRKSSLRKFSGDHSFDYFDVDGDGFGEYIFIDHGILYLYDHDKSELFTRDFGSGKVSGPILFTFSQTDRKVGVFDNDKKLIYLIDTKGNELDGFPLRGESLFSIGKLSESSGFHLIVGGSDSFLYNYKIRTGNQ